MEKTLIQENFWKNKSLVKKTIKQKKIYEDILNSYNNSFSELNNLNDLFNLASQEKDKDTIEDCILKINEIFEIIKKNEINCFYLENDDLNVYIEIHAGAGGTESQDWADMLRRMYMKWFDKKKYNYQIISEHKGEEATLNLQL